jgi:hypothetical protein
MNKVKQKTPLTSRTRAARSSSASLREAGVITLGWTGSRNFLYKRLSLGAQVAQLVEQRTENPCVGGSIPPLGTISASRYLAVVCRVEALDGFDEDTFRYQHRLAWRAPLSVHLMASRRRSSD